MIKFKQLTPDTKLPKYGSELAVGADIFMPNSITLPASKVTIVPTGLQLADCPNHIEIQVRMRSGWSTKGLLLANGIGSIDADYRGEIKLIILNSTDHDVTIEKGDRIAQIVPSVRMDHQKFEWGKVTDTERKDGGLGHTGR